MSEMPAAGPPGAWARLRRLLPGLWAGMVLAVAGVATPAPFATLARPEAGRVVARVLASEAWASLVFAVLWLLITQRLRQHQLAGRSALDADTLLVLGALFATVLGYFGLQPMMAAARAGQGAWSFAALHAVSSSLFALKAMLLLALAWRMSAR